MIQAIPRVDDARVPNDVWQAAMSTSREVAADLDMDPPVIIWTQDHVRAGFLFRHELDRVYISANRTPAEVAAAVRTMTRELRNARLGLPALMPRWESS